MAPNCLSFTISVSVPDVLYRCFAGIQCGQLVWETAAGYWTGVVAWAVVLAVSLKIVVVSSVKLMCLSLWSTPSCLLPYTLTSEMCKPVSDCSNVKPKWKCFMHEDSERLPNTDSLYDQQGHVVTNSRWCYQTGWGFKHAWLASSGYLNWYPLSLVSTTTCMTRHM